MFDKINHQIDIFIDIEQVKFFRILQLLVRHTGIADQLQLM